MVSTSNSILAFTNEEWPKAFRAVSQGFGLSPRLQQRINPELILAHLDEARLSRLAHPLILPHQVISSRENVKTVGLEVLFSDQTQMAIANWGQAYEAIPILQEVIQTVSALLKAHRMGDLANPQLVLRALPVLSVCNFFPEGEGFRRDLVNILDCDNTNVRGLIRSYKIAALLADNSRINAVDQRILSDPIWSVWIQGFLREGNTIIKLSQPVTQWEFSQSEISGSSLNSICQWLFRKE